MSNNSCCILIIHNIFLRGESDEILLQKREMPVSSSVNPVVSNCFRIAPSSDLLTLALFEDGGLIGARSKRGGVFSPKRDEISAVLLAGICESDGKFEVFSTKNFNC